MKKFRYTANRSDGRLMTGDIDAASADQVLTYLRGRDLQPLSISELSTSILKKDISFFSSISEMDKIFLCRHLSLMLRLGTDLFHALEILIEDTDNKVLKSILLEIQSSLERGQPFYLTFANYPQYFSPVFVNLIEAGEAAGTLDESFENLAVILAKSDDLRKKIRGALIYPAILTIGSISVLFFLVSFAIPRIATVFSETTAEIPFFSRIVFAIGNFFSAYLLIILLFFIALGTGLFYFFLKTPTGRLLFLRILSRIPVIKKVVLEIGIERFSSTLSSLLKANVPIIRSLEITANSSGNEDIKNSVLRVAHEGINKGLTLGEAFKREKSFPNTVTSLIVISERAGRLEEVLHSLSSFYESEIDASLKAMIAFIEPVLLVIIGAVVALIALSVIVPIYQLVGQF